MNIPSYSTQTREAGQQQPKDGGYDNATTIYSHESAVSFDDFDNNDLAGTRQKPGTSRGPIHPIDNIIITLSNINDAKGEDDNENGD